MFTKITYCLANLPLKRLPWLLLALFSSGLVAYALYTQHGPEQLWPCVQCIYQRTAMIGIALFAWLGFACAPGNGRTSALLRWFALVGWLTSAIAGAYSAYYHSWIQAALNPLFNPCQPHPNFPSWAPLHYWLPQVFDAGGLCGEIDWQWAGLSMPQWLFVIFTTLGTIALVVSICYALRNRIQQSL
ncbi:MAG: disulfide bond formation protein B [Firmicutes bacterium]|nr:disulfide bond formation protein B [Bacillota bacterium]